MLITVVIPTVRGATLNSAIESIRRQTYTDWELLLVTQGTEQKLAEVADAAVRSDPRIRRVHLERCGISLARNAGVREARGEIVAFTDDDCEARSDWLAVTHEIFVAEPEIGLLGGALVEPKEKRRGICKCPSVDPADVCYKPLETPNQPPWGWTWAGANLALRKTTLELVGSFDHELGAGGTFPVGEETDIGFRLEALGIPMRVSPRSIVDHTFGHRFGLKSVMRNARNYAYGTGALAGKLTLKGNPAGLDWLQKVRRQCLLDRRIYRYPFSLLRLANFTAGYRRCVRDYRLDADGNLTPR